jgi:hypothetical protein
VNAGIRYVKKILLVTSYQPPVTGSLQFSRLFAPLCGYAICLDTKKLKIHEISNLKFYRNLEQKWPSMLFERLTNFIVVTNFEKNQLSFRGIRLKKQAQAKTCSALEKIQPEFSDASSPVRVRRAPCVQHGYQGFIHCHAILDW